MPLWPRNTADKSPKLPTQHPKLFFVSNPVPKSAIFRVCFQKFDKIAMLKLHSMLLHKYSKTVHIFMASNGRKPTPRFECIMWMWTELPKRTRAGQRANEFSPGFKTKNTRKFFKLKKIMVKSWVWLLPWSTCPQKVGWIDMKEMVLSSANFSHIEQCSWPDLYIFFFKKKSVSHENFGLMFSRFFSCTSINIHIPTL